MASGSTNQNEKSKWLRLSPSQSEVVPNDIISEILLLLPAKSICRFKSCSKFFFELTEDKCFLKQHSDNSLLKDDTFFFIQRSDGAVINAERRLKIHALHKQNASSSSGVHTRFLEFLGEAEILASSNGLLFCRKFSNYKLCYDKQFVCNPTTMSCSYVPIPISSERLKRDCAHVEYVFECDSEEFKLFAFYDTFRARPSFECFIYDPRKGVWKVRKELFFVRDWYMKFNFSVFYKGIIHVLSPWKPYRRLDNGSAVPHIATYDVESGMSRMFSIPRESKKIHIDYPVDPDNPLCIEPHTIARIFKWGKRGSSEESICLVKMEEMCFFRIWVLSDYERKRWSSLKHVNLIEMGFGKEGFLVSDFIVMNGDCLLFATKKTVYKYDLVGEREGRLEEVCGHELKWVSFIPYSSTLRSCG